MTLLGNNIGGVELCLLLWLLLLLLIIASTAITAIIGTIVVLLLILLLLGARPPYQLRWLIFPLPDLWGRMGREGGDNCV